MPATMIASDLRVEFGRTVILDAVDVNLSPGHRVGLVGPNGIGKSTLLRVLAGQLRPDRGRVTVAPPSASIGLLQQEAERSDESVAEMVARRTGVTAAITEFDAATTALATGDDGAEDRYSAALDRWLGAGAADFDYRLETVWADFGLPVEILRRPTRVLSGGEAARVGLVVLQLSAHDVLLLDEPTNDLDLDGLGRLESIVLAESAPQLIVSHDRSFLERVVTDVLELDEHTRHVTPFSGGWNVYLAEKATARRHAEEAFAGYTTKRESLTSRAQREREWMTQGVARAKRLQPDRDKLGRKARQETTEQLAARASRSERAIERLKTVDKPWEGWELRFEIAAAPRSGDVAARLSGAVIERGNFRLGPIDVEIGSRERIALLGPNGSGKSTLIAALFGRLPLAAGTGYVGPGVVLGEIDQARAQFDGEGSLLDRFMAAAGMLMPEARTLLAKFGLGAGHLMRSAASLSPGERTRGALALLQAAGVNCLVLDEPTNHLDLPAIEQLEAALDTYAGTLILVTHDRALLANVRIDRSVSLQRPA